VALPENGWCPAVDPVDRESRLWGPTRPPARQVTTAARLIALDIMETRHGNGGNLRPQRNPDSQVVEAHDSDQISRSLGLSRAQRAVRREQSNDWSSVDPTITVGRFATITHLSVKTLRYYHEVGLLAPSHIDQHSGYRHYSLDQVAEAVLIRRLRELRMPIADIRGVLLTETVAERNELLRAHLDRLEHEVHATQVAIESLRALLVTETDHPPQIVRRVEPEQPALAISATLAAADVITWWSAALTELRTLVHAEDLRPRGPISGVFDQELFRHESGTATVLIPLADPTSVGRARPIVTPPVDVVVTTHTGSPQDSDLAYSRLGCYIAEQSLTAGPTIREHYLRDASDTPDEHRWITEIAWPLLPGGNSI
jgi:DNA-binding transcriptional MerR regulator